MYRRHACIKTSCGSAMVQWCIAALPLLLLGAISIELSHWHATRQRLTLAVQRAVDATSLSGGTTNVLERHLSLNLASDLRMPMRVCVTDDVGALMADFVDRRLSTDLGQRVIRHDHIAAQHRRALSKGWPQGRGPRSRKTIFEANRLNVKITAQFRPLSPWVRHVLNPVIFELTHQAIMQSHRQSERRRCFNVR